MTSGQPLNEYTYQDNVPTDGIICPICLVQCHTLQNLNRHLDVEHNEEDSKGALLSWLRQAQKKMTTTLATPKIGTGPSKWAEPLQSFSNLNLGNQPVFFVSDTVDRQQADTVSRDHWQRETGQDVCHVPDCNKVVGKAGVGKQHCRKCGKLFCEAHTQYEMKLDRQAKHDPEGGIWCKVCMTCYVSRPGYAETGGATRSRTQEFLKQRGKTIDRVYLESNRLEKRLEKLAKIHHADEFIDPQKRPLSPSSASLNSFSLDHRSDSSRDSLGSMLSPKSSFVSNSNSILSMKLKYRDGEQSVTKWQEDKSVKACPYCVNSFTLINRKHHCRLCGKVVCGNVRCSKMIPLFLDMSSDTFDDEPVGDTRACRDCQRSVFRRKLRHEEASKPLPIIQLYNQLAMTRKNIERQLPKFHEIILMLEKEGGHLQRQSFIKAGQLRKSLLDNFTLYDTLAKSIKTLPVHSGCMKRLQSNICYAANAYLQQNMLPLQMLPRILKSDKKKKDQDNSGSSERLELEAQLKAYVEQYNLVEGFIREANIDRKYDDVKTLKSSLDDLHDEIKRLKALLRH
ncbi:hypothetical protein INT47_005752 [Mucor saturninus]|uniref:FYVE-type domain-containing protein n=1 Tax=Mucor saturninus TaxID=64648 RepID=A0A8H7QP91_9FUNG|nr:hypothetical protein INT47_005752 [Mucor saturninus]